MGFLKENQTHPTWFGKEIFYDFIAMKLFSVGKYWFSKTQMFHSVHPLIWFMEEKEQQLFLSKLWFDVDFFLSEFSSRFEIYFQFILELQPLCINILPTLLPDLCVGFQGLFRTKCRAGGWIFQNFPNCLLENENSFSAQIFLTSLLMNFPNPTLSKICNFSLSSPNSCPLCTLRSVFP